MTRLTLSALGGTVLAAVWLAAGLNAPQASALPGQCMSSPWGGFCDEYSWPDGSFYHCQQALGFSNCYQACHDPVSNTALPTDVDPRTPC